MELYLSEYREWKGLQVTKKILQAITKFRQGKLEEIAHGHANGVEELYVEIGRAQGIEDVLHYLAEDIIHDLIDDRELEDAQGRRIQNIS